MIAGVSKLQRNCTETVTDPENPLNFEEELKQIDICAVGPLRVTSALYKKGLIKKEGQGKAIIISSQAGSAEWRKVQNKDNGGDYVSIAYPSLHVSSSH